MKFKSKKKKGFSLVEIIITFALVLGLIIGISSMILSGMNINSDSGKKQVGSQYAQQILEKLISVDDVKTIKTSGVSGYELNFNDIIFKSNNKNEFLVTDYSLDNYNTGSTENSLKGYTADITIKKNASGIGTTVEQEDLSSTSSNQYSLYVTGKGNNAVLKESKSSTSSTSLSVEDDVVKIAVEIKENADEKTIKIENKFSTSFSNGDAIILNLDFSGYEMSNKNLSFEVVVNNKDKKPLYLCLNESTNFNTNEKVKINVKSGQVNIYDNRSVTNSNSSDKAELYDISIKIKNDKGEVYEKTISRNLVIQDESK